MGTRRKVSGLKASKNDQVIDADTSLLCKVEFEALLKKFNCEVVPSVTIRSTGDLLWTINFVTTKK